MNITKRLSEMNRVEWVRHEWVRICPLSEEPYYLRGYERSPEDGGEAARDWDIWRDAIG